MRAIATREGGDLTAAEALVDIDLPDPVPGPHDLLVAVQAVSMNPVDTKVRRGRAEPGGDWRVLGWDAAGVVRAIGAAVSGFAPGDEVYYAGDITRPGSNAQLQTVDARIAAHKPKSLDWASAAAVPLTAITAWETLFDRLRVSDPVPGAAKAILIIGGAGGVASIAVQLARQLTDLTVIATASRPESRDWIEAMGAHHVVDHSGDLAAQVEALGIGAPGFVFSTVRTETHLPAIAALIAPQGRFALIDDPKAIDIMPLKRKAASIHWELMFTRPMFATPDVAEQGKLLAEVARLIDAGTLKTTATDTLRPISAATLREAHARVESGRTVGKITLEGW